MSSIKFLCFTVGGDLDAVQYITWLSFGPPESISQTAPGQVRYWSLTSLKGTLHSVEKTLIQKAYCVYYYILKERRYFYVD